MSAYDRSIRATVTTLAQPRTYTQAAQVYGVSAAGDRSATAHGAATGLLRRMSWGALDDDGTAGGVTARASMGVES